jgi:hypothetical protein
MKQKSSQPKRLGILKIQFHRLILNNVKCHLFGYMFILFVKVISISLVLPIPYGCDYMYILYNV